MNNIKMKDLNNQPVVKLLDKLVSINSVFPNEERISTFLQKYLKDLGFNIQTVRTGKNRENIVATFGKSDAYLAFYGHMDTVPLPVGVSSPKFLIREGKGYGRGAVDMKGGIAAFIQAGKFAVENNLPVMLILGVDEEYISEGAHNLVDSELLNKIGFLISGESGQIKNLNQPFNVCLGRNGRILFEISVIGKAAHAAEEHKGINAVVKAAELINKIVRIKFPKHPRLGSTKAVIQEINAVSGSYSIPELCRFQVSIITAPNTKSADFEKAVREIAVSLGTQIEIKQVERHTPYNESYEVDLRHPFMMVLKKEVFQKNNLTPIYTQSVADENVFANRLNIPAISMGPIGQGAHGENEWVDLNSLVEIEEAYKSIIRLYKSSSNK